MSGPSFECDSAKDAENLAKHGVSFVLAQYAFADPKRVIAEDRSHSAEEARYFCFGQVSGGIMTVRFTHRAGTHFRRGLLAQRKGHL